LALLGSMRGYRLKMRKRNDRAGGPGWSGGSGGSGLPVPPAVRRSTVFGNILREGEYFKVGQRRLSNVRQGECVFWHPPYDSAPTRTEQEQKGPAQRREEHRARPCPREESRGANFR
jgi:hypothetical protein